jgi:hypothetical protein
MFYRLTAKNSHPTYEVNGTVLKIMPEPNWHGTDQICFIASDGELSDSITFTLHVTSEGENGKLPTTYCLYNAYPNPFNPTTAIVYDITKSSEVKLNVYDTQGRIVRILVDKKQDAGTYKIIFNASQLPSGVYFYTLRTNNYSNTKKMILIK